MGLTSAFSNAASGLIATAKAVQTVSSNVSNALTPGYAPREVALSSNRIGGVSIDAITRALDPGLLSLSRQAEGERAGASVLAQYWAEAEAVVGIDGNGLRSAADGLYAALVSASARPDLTSRLDSAVSAAGDLTTAFKRAQDGIQTARAQADGAIARDVHALQSGLAQVQDLNNQIVRQRAAGQEALALEDQRQATIDQISQIIPLREIARSDGRVTLFTDGGQLLLDLTPADLHFDAAGDVDATMLTGSGLSGLTINGLAVPTTEPGPLGGGRLAAHFAWRDKHAVAAQTQLDSLAFDLINRFAAPGVDPTLAPGALGLFVQQGGGIPTAATSGLAGALAVNPALDGANWRLRDGLGTTAESSAINADGLQRLANAFSGSGATGFQARTATALTALSQSRQNAEDRQTNATQRADSLAVQTRSQGVDQDAELQRLLVIEQAYAANARVIETADAMLRRLLEI